MRTAYEETDWVKRLIFFSQYRKPPDTNSVVLYHHNRSLIQRILYAWKSREKKGIITIMSFFLAYSNISLSLDFTIPNSLALTASYPESLSAFTVFGDNAISTKNFILPMEELSLKLSMQHILKIVLYPLLQVLDSRLKSLCLFYQQQST